MLFNSHVFVLAFLPVTLAGFLLLCRLPSKVPARLWLLAASLVFYGWWGLRDLALLLLAIGFNYGMGLAIRAARARGGAAAARRSRALMALGVAANLALLAYYKYAVFVAGNAAALTGLDFAVRAVALPLGISFFTFQQIAYLVDVHRGEAEEYSLADYALFVSFFPQLIAGPIVHHRELIPPLHRPETYRFRETDFAAGIAFFVIGLVKKLVIADPVGALADPVFMAAAVDPPGLVEAWLATLAFSLGLYFDFSAYSDMAVGLARMFGLRLAYNFNSPYKADSIVEFWRRWHMTLSRFLRDYVYIPLGGSRQGPWRRHANLMATMLLGGLWHGAGWTFVAWGGLHGLYLLVNHAWNGFAARTEAATGRRPRLGAPLAQALTLLAVMVAWVFFAAPSFAAAMAVLAGMLGANGAARPELLALAGVVLDGGGLAGLRAEVGGTVMLHGATALGTLALGLVVVLAAPNSQEIVDGRAERVDEPRRWHRRLRFRPGPAAALVAAAAFLVGFALMSDVREFVYFQF